MVQTLRLYYHAIAYFYLVQIAKVPVCVEPPVLFIYHFFVWGELNWRFLGDEHFLIDNNWSYFWHIFIFIKDTLSSWYHWCYNKSDYYNYFFHWNYLSITSTNHSRPTLGNKNHSVLKTSLLIIIKSDFFQV